MYCDSLYPKTEEKPAVDKEPETVEKTFGPQFKVMMARFPGNNQEHPESSGYYISLYEHMKKDPWISQVIPWRKSDTPITMCRNLCIREAIALGADYVLMIDSDMHPDLYLGKDPTAKPFWDSSWEFMMERRTREDLQILDAAGEGREFDRDSLSDEVARDISPCCIAAPYCGPPPNENVYVFLWRKLQNDHPNIDFGLSAFEREEAARRGGIEEAAALPTGLILYDIRVFKKLPTPWFDYEWTDKYESAKASTEDVYQTRNQSLLDMPCFVNWDAWAGHIKLKTVGKPVTLKVQDVHKSLVDAVKLGHNRGEKLILRS